MMLKRGNDEAMDLFFMTILMLLVFGFLTLISGCGAMLKSSEHVFRAEGEAKITHEVKVNTDICNELDGEDRKACIKNITSAASAAGKEANNGEAPE